MRNTPPVYRCSRRYVLAGLCALPLSLYFTPLAMGSVTAPLHDDALQAELAKLETASGGRLGVASQQATGGKILSYRGDERFPLCSTFKAVAAAAILRDKPQLLNQRIHYTRDDLLPWSPITEKNIENGLTVAELCAAIVQYSDNTAANIILRLLGGPEALTAFSRTLGDTSFRLDRYEVELNAATPGDPRDSSTPTAMCRTLSGLLCGNLLPKAAKEQLTAWMLGCATGVTRIPAATPQGWRAAHKTGGWREGTLSTANDMGVLFPPSDDANSMKNPLVMTIFLSGSQRTDLDNDKIIASAARLLCAAEGLARPNDNMY